jgi:hypothetical protein
MRAHDNPSKPYEDYRIPAEAQRRVGAQQVKVQGAPLRLPLKVSRSTRANRTGSELH